MSLDTDSTSGSEAPAVVTLDSGTAGKLSITDAVRSIGSWREKQGQDDGAAPKEPATPAKESTSEVDAAPPQEATSETEGEIDPAESLPPLELPRSWTKEQAAHWNALPRETQEYLTERASKDSAEVRRVQNEAAEARKAIEAERQRTEQTRLQYESALPVLMQQLQAVQAGQFGDIQSQADVDRISVEDPLRYIQFLAHREKVGRVEMELHASQQRNMQEYNLSMRRFIDSENQKLIEKVPEFSDQEKHIKARVQAASTLKEIGYSEDELQMLANGQVGLNIHDHRTQMIIHDAIRYREMKSQQKVAAETVQEKLKGVPPVQRPGVPQGRNAGRDAEVKNLNQQLDKASGMKAYRLAAQLAAARRR
jgi:hypothetical protein